jgi:hypothetical protein
MGKRRDKEETKFVLKDQPFIDVTVRAYRTFDEKIGKGVLFMTFADTTVDVSITDDKTGKVTDAGCIAGAIGGTTLLRDKVFKNQEYAINAIDLWNAFQDELEKVPNKVKREEDEEQ